MGIAGAAVLIPLASRSTGTKAAAPGTTVTDTGAASGSTATAPKKVSVAAVTNSDHVRGPDNAPITLVEYSDFQCPFCGAFHPTLTRLLSDYPNKIRWVYRHFPLTSIHPQAQPAAEAAECAAAQGKFWEYADAIFENQQSLGDSYYPELAKTLKFNTTKFEACRSAGDGRAKISADVADASALGVNGTPTSYINGTEIAGALPYETVKAQVDAILAKS